MGLHLMRAREANKSARRKIQMRSTGDSKCRLVRRAFWTTSLGVTGVSGGKELTREEGAMDEVFMGATVGRLRGLPDEEKGKVSTSEEEAEAVMGVLGMAIALAAMKAANKYS